MYIIKYEFIGFYNILIFTNIDKNIYILTSIYIIYKWALAMFVKLLICKHLIL